MKPACAAMKASLLRSILTKWTIVIFARIGTWIGCEKQFYHFVYLEYKKTYI